MGGEEYQVAGNGCTPLDDLAAGRGGDRWEGRLPQGVRPPVRTGAHQPGKYTTILYPWVGVGWERHHIMT